MNYIKHIQLLLFTVFLLPVNRINNFTQDFSEEVQHRLENLKHFDKMAAANALNAVKAGDLHELEKALDKADCDVNSLSRDGQTALMCAVQNGRVDMVKLLLNKGADPHIITMNDNTALREAVKTGIQEIIILFLNISSRFRKDSMDSALVEASQKGDVANVELLLTHGADPNSKACSNVPQEKMVSTTPLIEAAREGHTSIVRLLLEKGANPALESDHGLTASQIAEQNGYKEIVVLIHYKTIS